jgi:hypothetical protein
MPGSNGGVSFVEPRTIRTRRFLMLGPEARRNHKDRLHQHDESDASVSVEEAQSCADCVEELRDQYAPLDGVGKPTQKIPNVIKLIMHMSSRGARGTSARQRSPSVGIDSARRSAQVQYKQRHPCREDAVSQRRQPLCVLPCNPVVCRCHNQCRPKSLIVTTCLLPIQPARRTLHRGRANTPA